MGLTIFYTIQPDPKWSWKQCIEKIREARQFVTTIPHLYLTEVYSWSSKKEHDKLSSELETGSLAIGVIERDYRSIGDNPWHPSDRLCQNPRRMVGFGVNIAHGADSAYFSIADYPSYTWKAKPLKSYIDKETDRETAAMRPYWEAAFDEPKKYPESIKIIRGVMKKYNLRRLHKEPMSGSRSGVNWREAVAVYKQAWATYVKAGTAYGVYRSHRRGYGTDRCLVSMQCVARSYLIRSDDATIWFAHKGDPVKWMETVQSAEFKEDMRLLMEGKDFRVPGERAGYRYVKTHYAANPELGGWPNFVVAHLGILAIVEHMQTLGFRVTVRDEGSFWETRDYKVLAHELSSLSEAMAAFFGAIKDAAGPEVQSEISKFPNFEYLEARGANGQAAPLIEVVKNASKEVKVPQGAS